MISRNNVLIKYEIKIEAIVAVIPVPEMEERYLIIEAVNEEFLAETDHPLPSHLLSIFTDWILIETLKDKDVDKVSNTEFAILSPRQLRRRDKRENSVLSEVLDYLDLRFIRNQDSLSKRNRKEQQTI